MCSLFGIIDYADSLSRNRFNMLLRTLSKECEIRGTDASGIAYNFLDRMSIYKRPLKASKMRFLVPSNVNVVTGHTRMTTKGSENKNINNHPFKGKVGNTIFALAHNGVIYNDETLRQVNSLPKTSIETDSYVAVQLLEKENEISFSSITKMAEQLTGSFCFSILTDNNDVYLVKGNNPLHIYDCGGFYVYASTKEILDNTLLNCRIKPVKTVELKEEQILLIKNDGNIYRTGFTMKYPFGSYNSYYFDDICTTSMEDAADIDYLIEYAGYFGVSEEAIRLLIEIGYSTMDIEDMLYNPQTLVNEINSYYKELMIDEYKQTDNNSYSKVFG